MTTSGLNATSRSIVASTILLAVFVFVALAAAADAPGQEGEEGALKWSSQAGNWVGAPAVAADGTVYAGVRGKGLHAFSPEGELKWVFTTGDRRVLRRLLLPHLSDMLEYSLLAVAADGSLYVGNENEIHALSTDGKHRWSFAVPGSHFSTAALGADGAIYVVNRNNTLYALTPAGKRKWAYEMKQGRFSAGPAAPAVGADGTIYVGDFGNYLHALTPEGKPKWTVRTQEEGRIVALALAGDGTIYMASGPEEPSRRTAIRAFTSEGQHKWSYELSKGVPFDPLAPVIDSDGTIYSGLAGLIALTPEGKRKWQFATEQGVQASPGIGADGTIYVVTDKLYAVSPQGTLLWSSKPVLGPLTRSPPAIGADGTIYVGTDGGYGKPEEGALFAFRSPTKGHSAVPSPGHHPPHATGPQARALEALQEQDIPFAPERFLECVSVGDYACVNHFLAAGMSLSVQDERGANALMRALHGRHLDIARLLIDQGADVNARRRKGSGTVLWDAAHAGRLDFVELLLAKGADPDLPGTFGSTALMRAAHRGDSKIVKALLDRGADVNIKNNEGRTALDYAKTEPRASPGVIAMLEEAARK